MGNLRPYWHVTVTAEEKVLIYTRWVLFEEDWAYNKRSFLCLPQKQNITVGSSENENDMTYGLNARSTYFSDWEGTPLSFLWKRWHKYCCTDWLCWDCRRFCVESKATCLVYVSAFFKKNDARSARTLPLLHRFMAEVDNSRLHVDFWCWGAAIRDLQDFLPNISFYLIIKYMIGKYLTLFNCNYL